MLAVDATLVGSVLLSSAAQIMGAVGVGVAAGAVYWLLPGEVLRLQGVTTRP